MFAITYRCAVCGGRIWPWQHFGMRVVKQFTINYWHIYHEERDGK